VAWFVPAGAGVRAQGASIAKLQGSPLTANPRMQLIDYLAANCYAVRGLEEQGQRLQGTYTRVDEQTRCSLQSNEYPLWCQREE
jgi:hypothetical protein